MPRKTFWEDLPDKCRRCLSDRDIEPNEPIPRRKLGRLTRAERRLEFEAFLCLSEGERPRAFEALAAKWNCTPRHARRTINRAFDVGLGLPTGSVQDGRRSGVVVSAKPPSGLRAP